MTSPPASSSLHFPSREGSRLESNTGTGIPACALLPYSKVRQAVKYSLEKYQKTSLGSVCPLNPVKRDILTVKEAGKDGAFQHNQQQGANHGPSRDSQSAWTEEGRPCGIRRRQGSNHHPSRARAGKSLREVCRGASCFLQHP